jgi:hypothetical protein
MGKQSVSMTATMDRKQISLFMTLVLLGALAIVASADRYYIFRTNPSKFLSIKQAFEMLGNGSEIAPKDVARILARINWNTKTKPTGVSSETLVGLNIYDTEKCTSSELSSRTYACGLLSGNIKRFCEACLEYIKTECSGSPQYIVKPVLANWAIKDYITHLNASIAICDSFDYPQKECIEDFVSNQERYARTQFQSECTKLDTVEYELKYFGLDYNTTLDVLAESYGDHLKMASLVCADVVRAADLMALMPGDESTTSSYSSYSGY